MAATTSPRSPRETPRHIAADEPLRPRYLSGPEHPRLPAARDSFSDSLSADAMYPKSDSDHDPVAELEATNARALRDARRANYSLHDSPQPPMHPQMLKVSPDHNSPRAPAGASDTPPGADAADALCAKSKRSPSSSNDVSHERDRFRARYVTFNPPSAAGGSGEPAAKIDCDNCERISYKTKKLNFQSPLRTCSPECVAAVLSEYSLAEPVSPLDEASNLFGSYELCTFARSSQVLRIHQLSVPQLQTAFHWYFKKPLPSTNSLFPWLHGLHKENFAQRSFFAAQGKIHNNGSLSDDDLHVPKPDFARFIMCVECSPVKSAMTRVIRNTVAVDQILQKIQYSRSEVMAQLTRLMADLLSSYPAAEIESVTSDIVADCLETGFMPIFLDTDPKKGISLRNFHIQVNKAATCSDFVVYASGSEEEARSRSIARLLKVAQMLEGKSGSTYNVFMLESGATNLAEDGPMDITTIRDTPNYAGHDNTKKTSLLLYSMMLSKADTFQAWDADYPVKEKVETTRMTAATKLHLNVWSGNIWDHQVMMHYFKTHDEDTSPKVEITPLSDTRNLYCDPENSSLTVKDMAAFGPTLFSVLPPPRTHWQLFVYCHNEASFPSQNLLGELLFQYSITSRKATEVDDLHQLEFPSSGSVGFGDCRQENLMSIVNTCKLLYLYSSSTAESSLASLIYCSDGYTESSLLIFCYLMYAKNIPLEEAMLQLHNEYGRPFYVFNTDVQVLRKLELLLRKFSPQKAGYHADWAQLETISNHEINEILLGPSKQSGHVIPKRFRLGYIECSDSSSDSDSDEFSPPAIDHDRLWVEEVEGSLPSRILPYLYLGSLKHANNLTLMTKLGIEKIVSVGENLDWLHGYKFQAQHSISKTNLDGGDVEIFDISAKQGKAQHSVDSVMKVNNLQDDGIDDLTKSLSRMLDYIDDAHRRSDGKCKVLVHCRVGVSRSVTVVIAEVMRRLSLSLPKAYLYVRVRRLNIVIQPNLRFMYELFKWEEQERLRKKNGEDLRVIDWFVMCQEIKKLNQPFVYN